MCSTSAPMAKSITRSSPLFDRVLVAENLKLSAPVPPISRSFLPPVRLSFPAPPTRCRSHHRIDRVGSVGSGQQVAEQRALEVLELLIRSPVASPPLAVLLSSRTVTPLVEIPVAELIDAVLAVEGVGTASPLIRSSPLAP